MSAIASSKPLKAGSAAAEDSTVPKPLKPEALDALAAEYIAIQAELLQEQLALTKKMEAKSARLGVLAKQFTEVCNAHGSPHEKKSKLLSGLEYEVMTTVSSSSSLDQAAVVVFHGKCAKAEKDELFDQLFEKVSEYRARPGADAVLRQSAQMMTGGLAVYFLKCMVTKTNPPRLSAVRPREKEG